MKQTKNKQKNESDLSKIFDGILQEFGTNVPQISVIVAVIIGSLTLDDYFNAGAWSLTSIMCFAFIYVFKRQITPNVLTSLSISLFFLILGGGLLILFHHSFNDLFKSIINSKTTLSIYSGAFITIPIAILITSFRKQEKQFGLLFPKKIEDSICNQLIKTPFFKSGIVYEITFKKIDGDFLVVNSKLKYLVKNRTNDHHKWISFYRTDDPDFTMNSVKVNKQEIYTDQKYFVEHGFQYERYLKNKEEIEMEFDADIKYPIIGSEMYTTYDVATDQKVIINNPFSDLKLSFEVLYDRYSKSIEPIRKKDLIEIEFNKGLLPYQGVRVNWCIN